MGEDETKAEITMERALQIAFKNMDSSEFVEALIRDRVERLQRFHSNITGARVVVEVPHRSAEGAKPPVGIRVEIEVPGHNTIVAKGEQDRREMKGDASAIINRVFEAVERQLEQIAAIRNGVVKHHGSTGDTGVVVRIFPEQNYGFVEVKDSPDLYFYARRGRRRRLRRHQGRHGRARHARLRARGRWGRKQARSSSWAPAQPS